eukprot:109281-Ditylum_brightwellii.AAC.1
MHSKCFCMLCKNFGEHPNTHDNEYCKCHKVVTEMRKQSGGKTMSIEELYASSKKLSKELKNLRKSKKGHTNPSLIANQTVIDSLQDME